jgi:MoaA/NifB/PqqE/SkfB family radical SAM enzyme
METIGFTRATRLFLRGSRNYFTGKPIVISFEVTASCNAHCLHCDKGGILKDEKRISPSEIRGLYRELRPVAVQVSGGEPLLRKDVLEIVRAIKEPNGTPYLILCTNGYSLNKGLYMKLRQAGVDQFSVSLDFPDERHDRFRRLPGLFRHLEETIPELANLGHNDVVLNTVITSENLHDLLGLYRTAEKWGTSLSYSAYSAFRTGNQDLLITSPEDLSTLRAIINELIRMKRNGKKIRNPISVLENISRFFMEGAVQGCKTGILFFLITPDGFFRPCAHKQQQFETHKELKEKYSRTNTCGGCYVAIRGYSDKSFFGLFKEQIMARFIPIEV